MQFHENYSLKKLNTFGINAYARYFAKFNSVEELQLILQKERSISSKMILGGGSNILLTGNYDGLVLKNEIPGIKIIKEEGNLVYIRAGAGVNWHGFVQYCVNNNYAGIENLSLIPGNVGAAPMQNIGAYGAEIKDVFYELEAFHTDGEWVQKFSAEDCEFGYRESIFKKKLKGRYVILNVTCCLKKKAAFNISYGAIEEELNKMNVQTLSVKAISDAVIKIRTSKLPNPRDIGNAGSFFKNPVITTARLHELHELQRAETTIPYYKTDEAHYKIPAGWLIEQCGWKGYRKGDAGCYDKQALVLVNYGDASGQDIYDLSEEIQISVKDKFGIDLEREVNII